jgi:hypothetical protein
MFANYDLCGGVPTNLQKIPNILLEVKAKPAEDRREREISAMRMNWMYLGMMNGKFLVAAKPDGKDCEDTIRWIRHRVKAISNQYVGYAKSPSAEKCKNSWILHTDQPRQHGVTSWADIISTIKTTKTRENPNWHVVLCKLVHGLYEDHTTNNHPKMFGRWRLGVIIRLKLTKTRKAR